jgi:hypothetical protein
MHTSLQVRSAFRLRPSDCAFIRPTILRRRRIKGATEIAHRWTPRGAPFAAEVFTDFDRGWRVHPTSAEAIATLGDATSSASAAISSQPGSAGAAAAKPPPPVSILLPRQPGYTDPAVEAAEAA